MAGEFETAFEAEAAKAEEPHQTPMVDGQETFESPEVLATVNTDAPTEESVAEVVPEPIAEPVAEQPAEPATPATPAEQPAEFDYKAQFEQIRAELEALKSKSATTVPPESQTPAAEQPPAVEAPDFNTFFKDDEKKILEEYEADWPEVSKAESLRRKFEMAQLRDEIFREVAQAFQYTYAQIQPLVQKQVMTEEEAHYSAIRAAHPDFDQSLVEKVDAWADTQPTHIKHGIKLVLEKGKADEVIAVFNDYKKQTGSTKPQEPTQPAAPPPNVSNLRPVRTNAPVIPTATDDSDFAGAWEKAEKAALSD